MALVLRAQDTTFTNSLGKFEPIASGLVAGFDFGVSESESLKNYGAGDDGLFNGSGFVFDNDSVLLPQNSSNSNFFRTPTNEFASTTYCFCIKENLFASMARVGTLDGVRFNVESPGVTLPGS